MTSRSPPKTRQQTKQRNGNNEPYMKKKKVHTIQEKIFKPREVDFSSSKILILNDGGELNGVFSHLKAKRVRPDNIERSEGDCLVTVDDWAEKDYTHYLGEEPEKHRELCEAMGKGYEVILASQLRKVLKANQPQANK